MANTRLEYRLNDTGALLYYFNDLPEFEMRNRRMCLYWIQDSRVYEIVTTRMEKKPDQNIFIIYIKEVDDEFAYEAMPGEVEKNQKNVSIEFREFIDDEVESPFLTKWDDIFDHEYIFDAVMASDQVKINNLWYWVKTREMDEDRKIFVVYVEKSEEQD